MRLLFANEDSLKNDFAHKFLLMKGGKQAVFRDEHDRLGRFVPKGQEIMSFAESCAGSLRPFCDPDVDIEELRYEALREKYGPFC